MEGKADSQWMRPAPPHLTKLGRVSPRPRRFARDDKRVWKPTVDFTPERARPVFV
jgi:hypothetical protein